MADIQWEVMGPEYIGWHGPPLPRCPIGIKGHSWAFSVEEGQLTIQRKGDDECLGEQCVEDLGMMGFEDIHSREEYPVKFVFEPGCGNPGGWHGMNRCDCGYAWVMVPDADVQG